MNIFKKISNWLFGKKDCISPECEKIYSELEKIKKEYISDEEFRSLTIEQQVEVVKQELNTKSIEYTNVKTGETVVGEVGKIPHLKDGTYVAKTIIPETKLDIVTSGYLRREDDPFPEPGVITTSSSDKTMNVDMSGNPPKITFFHPNDNKEIKLDEKKSEEIKATKKKRQYKKKGKK